jgi:hypothetical protein
MIKAQSLLSPNREIIIEDKRVMPDLLSRTCNALRWGQTAEDIHAMLKSEGMSDYDAWLTYKGAELLARSM